MYNSLGNIYTNSTINIIVIDFSNNDILYIKGSAKIIEEENLKKKLKIVIETKEINIEHNSFFLKYNK